MIINELILATGLLKSNPSDPHEKRPFDPPPVIASSGQGIPSQWQLIGSHREADGLVLGQALSSSVGYRSAIPSPGLANGSVTASEHLRSGIADLRTLAELRALGEITPAVFDVAWEAIAGVLIHEPGVEEGGFPAAIGDGGLFGEWENGDQSVSLLVPPRVEHAYIYCHSSAEDRTLREVTGSSLAQALRWLSHS